MITWRILRTQRFAKGILTTVLINFTLSGSCPIEIDVVSGKTVARYTGWDVMYVGNNWVVGRDDGPPKKNLIYCVDKNTRNKWTIAEVNCADRWGGSFQPESVVLFTSQTAISVVNLRTRKRSVRPFCSGSTYPNIMLSSNGVIAAYDTFSNTLAVQTPSKMMYKHPGSLSSARLLGWFENDRILSISVGWHMQRVHLLATSPFWCREIHMYLDPKLRAVIRALVLTWNRVFQTGTLPYLPWEMQLKILGFVDVRFPGWPL